MFCGDDGIVCRGVHRTHRLIGESTHNKGAHQQDEVLIGQLLEVNKSIHSAY